VIGGSSNDTAGLVIVGDLLTEASKLTWVVRTHTDLSGQIGGKAERANGWVDGRDCETTKTDMTHEMNE